MKFEPTKTLHGASQSMVWVYIILAILATSVVLGGVYMLSSAKPAAAGTPGTPGQPGLSGTANTNSFNVTPIGSYLSYSTGNITQAAYNSTIYLEGTATPFASPTTSGTGVGTGVGNVPRGSSGMVYIGNGGNASGDIYFAMAPFTSTQTSAFTTANSYAPAAIGELAAKPQSLSFSNGSTATSTTLLASGTANAIVAGQNGPTNAIFYLQGGNGYLGRNEYSISFLFNNTNCSKVWPVPYGSTNAVVTNMNAPWQDPSIANHAQHQSAAAETIQTYFVQTPPSAAGMAQSAALGLPAGVTVGLPPGITESFQVNMICGVLPVSSSIDVAINDKTDYFSNTGPAANSHLVNAYVDPNNNDLGKLGIYIDQAIVVN